MVVGGAEMYVGRTLLSADFDVAFDFSRLGKIKSKIKVNGSGQECPLYTSDLRE